MTKLFYDHLVAIEEVIAVIDMHDISLEEKNKIVALVDQTLHHHVLNVILTHLPREHHEVFLSKFHADPHDPNLLLFIQERVAIDIGKEIQKKAKEVKQTILKDIKTARKK